MRAAGIPAHVVTGYYGGTFNRFADYGSSGRARRMPGRDLARGSRLLRIDPTSVIAPNGSSIARATPRARRPRRRTRQGHAGGWPMRGCARCAAPAMARTHLAVQPGFAATAAGVLSYSAAGRTKNGARSHGSVGPLVLGWLTWTGGARRIPPAGQAEPRLLQLCAKLRPGIARRAHKARKITRARCSSSSRSGFTCRGRYAGNYSDLRYGAGSSPGGWLVSAQK